MGRERDEDDHEAIDDRPAKKQKTMPGPRSVRVRHILLRCADPGKGLPDDPMARRKKGQEIQVRTPLEAEEELMTMLSDLLAMQQAEGQSEAEMLKEFRKRCQMHSECSSADSAGQLSGDLGWISRGQSEPTFEQAAFTLRKSEISDITVTSRGYHLIQRIA